MFYFIKHNYTFAPSNDRRFINIRCFFWFFFKKAAQNQHFRYQNDSRREVEIEHFFCIDS